MRTFALVTHIRLRRGAALAHTLRLSDIRAPCSLRAVCTKLCVAFPLAPSAPPRPARDLCVGVRDPDAAQAHRALLARLASSYRRVRRPLTPLCGGDVEDAPRPPPRCPRLGGVRPVRAYLRFVCRLGAESLRACRALAWRCALDRAVLRACRRCCDRAAASASPSPRRRCPGRIARRASLRGRSFVARHAQRPKLSCAAVDHLIRHGGGRHVPSCLSPVLASDVLSYHDLSTARGSALRFQVIWWFSQRSSGGGALISFLGEAMLGHPVMPCAARCRYRSSVFVHSSSSLQSLCRCRRFAQVGRTPILPAHSARGLRTPCL